MRETRFYSDLPRPDFDHLPELCGYTTDPPAMYVGAPGKCGHVSLGFELDGQGRSILRDLERRVPLIVQQALYFDREMPDLPCVYILSSGGPNVDGDRYTQNFYLKKGSQAFVSTGAATKLAEMKYNYSGMRQTITLEADAYFEYVPEPVIPHKHTRYVSDTTITIDETATLFYSEIYMPGRKYHNNEIFQYDVLSVCAHAQRPDGAPLFREKFVITPKDGQIRSIGVMDGFDVFANVIVATPKEKAAAIYSRTEPFIDFEKKLACGVTWLPNEAGLLFKVLGIEPGPVKKIVRAFCSTVRMAIKGRPFPEEFPWR